MTNADFDFAMTLDESALEQRSEGEALIADEQVRVLAHENRLVLRREKTERSNLDDQTTALYMLLRCLAHPHPECRFQWVRVSLDFSANPNVRVSDLFPQRIDGTDPIKVTLTRSASLAMEFGTYKLGPAVGIERSTEQSIYYPGTIGSGINTSSALWDFQTQGEAPLYVDRDLHLVLAQPTMLVSVLVRVTLRAKVVAKGIAGIIPIVGRREVVFEAVVKG